MGATVFFQSTSELATLTNTFSVAGVPTDPTTISLIITDPTQAAATYTYALAEITRTTQGVYTKDIPCPTEGEWAYQWTGTGTASDTTAGTWYVHGTALGKLYATVEELKSRLGVSATDTLDDFELHQACFAASRALEQYCNRVFYRSATGTVRTFEPKDAHCVQLGDFNDLVSIATLKTDAAGDGTFETTWATSDYQLLPYNPAAAPEQKPYNEIRAVGTQLFPQVYSNYTRRDLVQVTGVFGWPAIPYGIKQAALLLAAETFRLKDAPLGVLSLGEFGAIRVRSNPKVAYYADPYQVAGGFA